jgi:hypothetical protein
LVYTKSRPARARLTPAGKDSSALDRSLSLPPRAARRALRPYKWPGNARLPLAALAALALRHALVLRVCCASNDGFAQTVRRLLDACGTCLADRHGGDLQLRRTSGGKGGSSAVR